MLNFFHSSHKNNVLLPVDVVEFLNAVLLNDRMISIQSNNYLLLYLELIAGTSFISGKLCIHL